MDCSHLDENEQLLDWREFESPILWRIRQYFLRYLQEMENHGIDIWASRLK